MGAVQSPSPNSWILLLIVLGRHMELFSPCSLQISPCLATWISPSVVAWRSGFATTHTGLRLWLKHWPTMVFSLLPARSRHLGDPTRDGAVPEGLMEWPRRRHPPDEKLLLMGP
jgi:hypothetical protein